MKNILDDIRCRAWGFVPSKLAATASDIILCIKVKGYAWLSGF